MMPSLIAAELLAFPPLDELDLQAQVVDDPLHHEVHEVGDLLGLVIEPRRRGEHDRAGLRGEREVAEMYERERRLPRNENQRAPLLERDVGGALEQRAARPRARRPPPAPLARADTPSVPAPRAR